MLYYLWLIKEIIRSSIDIMKIIWSPKIIINPSFEWIDVNTTTAQVLVLYGNSITLTPGTATVDTKDGMLLVHGLKQSYIDDLQNGEMQHRIKTMLCAK